MTKLNEPDTMEGDRSGLRSRAEQRVREKANEQAPRTEHETQRLLHELQVHQVELEMQNDELRRARDERAELFEKYEDLYEFAPVSYVTLDREGTIVAANLTTTTLLGTDRSALIGGRFGHYVAAADRAAFVELLQSVLKDGGRETREAALVSTRGLPLVVQIAASASRSGSECRMGLIDVTERTKAQKAMRATEAQLYGLAEMADDAIVMLDESGTITFCNRAAERLFESPTSEIIGQDLWSLFAVLPAPSDAGGAVRSSPYDGVRRVGGTSEVMAVRRDGTRAQLELSISWAKLHEIWHAIAVVRDLSERKCLEARLRNAQRLETVSLLAGGIAHDFNNILSVIMGYGSLLAAAVETGSPLRAHLHHVMEAGERGRRLIAGLLEFSTTQGGRPRAVDLRAAIRTTQEALTRMTGEGVRILVTCTAHDLRTVVDEGAVERVLTSLAANAIAAMPSGGTLTIVCEPVAIDEAFVASNGFGIPGHFACLSVTDTGIGMDAELLRRIFDPFFTTRLLGNGAGLGLSIVHGIVKNHGGFIDASSSPGAGTSFRVYLPLIPPESRGPEVEPEIVETVRGTETILLAEDDPAVRTLTELLLTQCGYRVLTATDGADAVAQFETHGEQIQLLLLDVVMPFKNGKEAYRAICELRPGIPTLFMSGYTADVLTQEDRDRGMQLISKPFTAAWLEGDIAKLVLPTARYEVWHDRAVFHFLTDPSDRAAYVANVMRAVRPGGHVIVATFAEDGPERCSGLPVVRYRPDQLHAEFGEAFDLRSAEREEHHTPTDVVQRFIYCYCRKVGPDRGRAPGSR